MNGKRGQAVLVPSYSGQAEMEKSVGNIYREVYPDAKVVFVNCDRVIELYGAIHCGDNRRPDFLMPPLVASSTPTSIPRRSLTSRMAAGGRP